MKWIKPDSNISIYVSRGNTSYTLRVWIDGKPERQTVDIDPSSYKQFKSKIKKIGFNEIGTLGSQFNVKDKGWANTTLTKRLLNDLEGVINA